MTLLRLIQIPSGSLLITAVCLFVCLFFVHSPLTVPSNDELVLISKKSWNFSEDLIVLSVYPFEKVINGLLLYLLGALEHEWIMTLHAVGNVIIPTGFNPIIFHRLKPPTRLSLFSSVSSWEFLRNPGYPLVI